MKITSKRKQLVAILGVCMAILFLIALAGEGKAGTADAENPPIDVNPTDWFQAREVHHWRGKWTLDTPPALDILWRRRFDLRFRDLPQIQCLDDA